MFIIYERSNKMNKTKTKIKIMKVYISGQITGLDIEESKANFKEAQNMIESLGHETVNPFDVLPYNPNTTWEEYMVADIRELFKCDAIFMLHNWEKSKGARIEKAIAEEMGVIIMYVKKNN